jgi:hypothetical protein
MARKVRLEYEGAVYHVINRGNYRSWIFESEGARSAFEGCLFEACEKSNWILRAFVVMRKEGASFLFSVLTRPIRVFWVGWHGSKGNMP